MEYWIHTGSEILGPFSGGQLKRLALAGKLKQDHKVSSDQKRWSTAKSVKGLVFANEDTFPASSKSQTAQGQPEPYPKVAATQAPPSEASLDALYDQLTHCLVTKEHAAGISECQSRLNCASDTARKILRLIERQTPRAEVIELMEKYAAVALQTCPKCGAPRQSDLGNCVACDAIFETREADSRYIQYLSDGRPVTSDVESVRLLLLDGKLTGSVRARWVEPKPEDPPWYDWRDSSDPKQWEKRRQWRPMEVGIGKEAFRLRLLFDARDCIRELAMYLTGLPVLFILVPFMIYMDVIVLIDTDSVLDPNVLGIDPSVPANRWVWLVKVLAFWGVSIAIIPLVVALGMLLIGWPLGNLAHLCCSGFLPKLPGQNEESGSRGQRRELLISISALGILGVAVLWWVLTPSQDDIYEQMMNRVRSEDPCRVGKVEGPIYQGLPPLSDLRTFLLFESDSKDPLTEFIVRTRPPNERGKLSYYRGAIVLLGQHGHAAHELIDPILARLRQANVREPEHARRIAEALVGMDSHIYDRMFRPETGRKLTPLYPIATEVLNLSPERVVKHVQEADERELLSISGDAGRLLARQIAAEREAPESKPYLSTLDAIGAAIAAKMDSIESFDSDYGKVILPRVVRMAPGEVGRRLRDRLASGTVDEFPRRYQEHVLPRLLIRVPDAFPTIERAFMDGRYFQNRGDAPDVYRPAEVRNGLLNAALDVGEKRGLALSERKIIRENVTAMAPLLKKVKSGELQFGEYRADSLRKMADDVLSRLE